MGYTPQQAQTARAIGQVFQKYGLDPAAGVAVAFNESGLNPTAVGDHGTSYGALQLHQGGALGSHNQAWANNPANDAQLAAQALVAAGGQKLHGTALQQLMTKVFERPANPTGDNNPANYQNALSILKGLGLNAPASASSLANTAGAAQAATTSVGGSGGSNAANAAAVLAGFSPTPNTAHGDMASSLMNNGDLLTAASLDNAGQQQMGGTVTPIHPAAAAAAVVGAPGGNQKANLAVQDALAQKGIQYTWGGTSPKTGFDCSGLMQYAYGKAGINIPRTTYAQLAALKPVTGGPKSWQPGDLIYLNNGDHVGMYIGNNQVVQAPHTGTNVQVSQLNQGWSQPYAVRRP